MQVTILNAYGRSNRGDSVLLDECIHEIREKLPAADIGVLLFDDYKISKLNQDITCLPRIGNSDIKNKPIANIHKILILIISIIYSTTKLKILLKLLPKNQAKALNYLGSSNLAISAPGGYIHDTNRAYLVALANIFIASRLSSKVILAPQSIGPLNSWIGRSLTRLTLNKCNSVCTRERYTLQFLSDIGVNKKLIEKCGDSAFWNDSVAIETADSGLASLGMGENKFIGMTVVNWTFPNTTNPTELSLNYATTLAKYIKETHTKTGLNFIIFNQVSDDIEMAERIFDLLEKPEYLIIDRLEREPWELRALIGRSEIFIGTRFHSCIFAIMAGIPTIAISYLPKTQFILEDLNLPERSTPINEINLDFLSRKTEHCLLYRDDESQKTMNAVKRYRRTFKRLADCL